MPKELWRDLELEEKILPGDRCCGADHKWFELKEEHLTFRHIMSEQSYPTQRKVIPMSEADFIEKNPILARQLSMCNSGKVWNGDHSDIVSDIISRYINWKFGLIYQLVMIGVIL